MSSARSGACRNATRRRPSGRCRLRARVGRARRWRRDAARPRERRRRPYGVVIDLIHVAEYVCKAVPVFHRHRRHRRGVRYLVRDRMEFTGARRCYTAPLFHPCAGSDPPGGQLGWSRGGSEAPGATKPAATSMRTGTSTTREYQRNHAQCCRARGTDRNWTRVDRKMSWSPAASSSQQRARVLTDVKARRFAPPPLRGADGLDAGSAHARPDWLLPTMLTHHYCPTFSAPQQHLRVWGTRWRGRREQLHQWTAVEQVELENS